MCSCSYDCRVHEVEQIAVAIEELHLVLLERRALHVVFRPELMVAEPAGSDVAHLALHVPALVAGRDVVEVDHTEQIAVDLDQHALPQTCRLDGAHVLV